MVEAEYAVGDYVEGRDEDYEVALAGKIEEVVRARDGSRELLFINELPGQFEGQRVALPTRWVKVYRPGA